MSARDAFEAALAEHGVELEPEPRFDPGGLVSIEEFIGRPPTPALIEGTLPRSGSAQVVAASGSGKTFIALHLAWHLASPQLGEWFGRAINAHGPVVYYPTEGLDTIGPRAAALQATYGPATAGIHVVENSPDFPLLTGLAAHRSAITEAVLSRTGGVLPAALIVDTQIGVMADAGVEENDNGGMQRALAMLQHICKPDALDCLLILVHHTGHGGDGGQRVGRARGASSQFGYMDAVIELENASPNELGKGPYYVRPTKFKPDTPWPRREEFRLVRIEGVGTLAEHVPQSALGGFKSAVSKARADKLVEFLQGKGGAATPSEIREANGWSEKVWSLLVAQAAERGIVVREGKGPSALISLPDNEGSDG